MENTLIILSMKMCSPTVVFFVFVIVSGFHYLCRNVLNIFKSKNLKIYIIYILGMASVL